MKRINIAIDGYSSCGKSTLARQLALKLGYVYVDTGAMYRAITLYLLENEIIREGEEVDAGQVIAEMENIEVDFRFDKILMASQTILNGKNVEQEIRGIEVSSFVSRISIIREVRQKLVKIQRKIGTKKGVVMEGRDIGSVVLPHAELKLFITADEEERIERRYRQLIDDGQQVSREQVRENIRKRDHADTSRTENPLIRSADAVVIDNTGISREEQLEAALKLARERMA